MTIRFTRQREQGVLVCEQEVYAVCSPQGSMPVLLPNPQRHGLLCNANADGCMRPYPGPQVLKGIQVCNHAVHQSITSMVVVN